jgi:hypothetical protein
VLGSVTVDPLTGSYTYTPTSDALSTGGADSFTITASDGYLGTASPTTIDISIPVPSAGPISPAIPAVPAAGGGGGSVGDALPPAWAHLSPTAGTDTGQREETEPASGRGEPGPHRPNSDPDSTSPAGLAATPRVPSAPILDSPDTSPSEAPSQPGEQNSPDPEVSLTNLVEGGTQGMIIALVLLVIGGWVFTRRVLES